MMGWTYTHRDKGQSNLDFFKSEFESDNDNVKVLDAAGDFRTV